MVLWMESKSDHAFLGAGQKGHKNPRTPIVSPSRPVYTGRSEKGTGVRALPVLPVKRGSHTPCQLCCILDSEGHRSRRISLPYPTGFIPKGGRNLDLILSLFIICHFSADCKPAVSRRPVLCAGGRKNVPRGSPRHVFNGMAQFPVRTPDRSTGTASLHSRSRS